MQKQFPTSTDRRQFIKHASIIAAAFPLLPIALLNMAGCATEKGHASSETSRVVVEDGCEWCGANDAPASLSWKTEIAPANEPGDSLIISGRVFQPDGITPASGILLYVYHTDANGYYSKNGKEYGNGRRHGRLRGWMRTNNDGRYEFRTIKPAPYPNRVDPAHIHITVSGPGYPEYWIDDYWFEGDPRITDRMLVGRPKRGGFSPIISPKRDEKGVLIGVRNIKLEKL